MFGKIVDIPRLQAWYGDEAATYAYSKLTLQPMPWTSGLLPLKQQVSDFCQSNFNGMLANCYRDHQDSVSWHSDDEPELGEQPVIASLSFGCERVFHLKQKHGGEKFKLPLQSGSLLVMSGDTQKNWSHAIHKTRIEKSMRINLTFRNIL
jgi:alkylated DNA repair dioxygenase AlkB